MSEARPGKLGPSRMTTIHRSGILTWRRSLVNQREVSRASKDKERDIRQLSLGRYRSGKSRLQDRTGSDPLPDSVSEDPGPVMLDPCICQDTAELLDLRLFSSNFMHKMDTTETPYYPIFTI
jgi:hypothetical protein